VEQADEPDVDADARNGERFAFEIEPTAALGAFRHPYAYA
jgi:hypothetical protein